MRKALVVAVVGLLAACTQGSAPGPVVGPDPAGTPGAGTSQPGRPTASPSPTPALTTPLVFAVHHTRDAIDLPLDRARAILAGEPVAWADLGQPGGTAVVLAAGPGAIEQPANPATAEPAASISATEALDRVRSDRDVVAIVPATEVDGRVRVARVAGVHPLLEPAGYPLTAPTDQPQPSVTRITVVGDMMLGRRVGRAYAQNPAAPLEPLAPRLAAADITVGNLESTLSDNGRPTQGGDSFFADPRMLDGLRLAGFDAVSLANNHLGDYGPRAQLETFAALDRTGIARFGAGPNLAAARAPWIVEHDRTRIAFLATESIGETPAATDTSPGTNRLNMPPRTGPLDTLALDRIAADIAAAKSRVDTVIVIPHWGAQYTHRPEASQRQVAARFAEAGADLVIGGHPHWVQGWDAVGDTTVVHSLGNFVFDMQFSRQVQEGVFVEIVLWGGRVVAVEPVPYVIRDHVPRPAGPADAARILGDLRSTSTGPYAG